MQGPKSEVLCLLWPPRGSLSLLRLEEEAFRLKTGERLDLEKLRGSLGSRWIRPEAFREVGAEWGNVPLEGAVAPSSRTQPSPLPGSQPLALE